MYRIFKQLVIAAGAVSLCCIPHSATAGNWTVFTAHVTRVEASYMPNLITFQIDQAAGACAAGQFLQWSPQGSDEEKQIANANAVYSLLMTALATGKQVTIYGNDTNCAASLIHIFNG